jgi:tellurite resistance protein TerC
VLGSPLEWGLFAGLVTTGLVLDLGVLNRNASTPTVKRALAWTIGWVTVATFFGLWVGRQAGTERGLEFATGYVLELALSVDNIFVFVLLFRTYAVPEQYRQRVLFWGILGAVVMRGIFVALGAALIAQFEPILYFFGALLAYTGIRLLQKGDEEEDPSQNVLFKAFRRVVPATEGYRGQSFFVKENGRWLATPLFLVLVAVETTDLIFAVDSVPAVFAVTKEPFIVYTSNIFAILGLRSMYFLIAGVIDKFWLLKPALALVLIFIGAKMLLISFFHVPIALSLGVIGTLLGGSVLGSLAFPRTHAAPPG